MWESEQILTKRNNKLIKLWETQPLQKTLDTRNGSYKSKQSFAKTGYRNRKGSIAKMYKTSTKERRSAASQIQCQKCKNLHQLYAIG